MAPTVLTILRRSKVEERTGYKKSSLYRKTTEGLFTKPIKIGERASGWPEHEVDAINAARIAGKSNQEIRKLVVRLEAARNSTSTSDNDQAVWGGV
jgi:prophage regulatory protein